MIIFISAKKWKETEERIAELERMVQNVSVEVFSPIADAEMPDGKKRKRITLNGITHAMYKKIMGIKEKKKAPLIHRV